MRKDIQHEQYNIDILEKVESNNESTTLTLES